MSNQPSNKQQNHPQEKKDRETINQIVQGNAEDPLNLAELARLRIRYQGFPGALAIKDSLDQILKKIGITEAELFEKTRQIHNKQRIYQVRSKFQEQEDWT
jgi:Protein of unknown function (DUF3288)